MLLVIAVINFDSVQQIIQWHILYLSNVLAIVHPTAMVAHLWALSVEEQFYFVRPF
jgi:peptidoglycan/LPS O-acetylase OafA/YrhL